MPLPSFYRSQEPARAWNVFHAAGYGAVLGALAALFKTLGPFAAGAQRGFTDHLLEIALGTLAFALLCGAAATLRNFLARRLV
jgi:hypothetical protein